MNDKKSEVATYHKCNGEGFIVESNCRLPELKCYVDEGTVYFEATVMKNGEEHDGLQYLTPEIAMKMSKSLRDCAIKALEQID